MELERKNINRGTTKLRVWKDSIELFSFAYKVMSNVPFELNKTRNNEIRRRS